jgi:hypothetical protein
MDTRTHYLPAFLRVNTTAVKHDGEGHLQAICGAWTTPDKHKIDPAELTCWGCKTWMENLGIADQKES